MYHGSVKLSELEEEIGKEKLNEFIANIQDAFGEKEKVYFNFLSYDRFEDRYTDPAIEKKGNYLQNVLLYEVLGNPSIGPLSIHLATRDILCVIPAAKIRRLNAFEVY